MIKALKKIKNNKKIRLGLFIASALCLTMIVFLLTPLGRSVTGWNVGKSDWENECNTFSGIELCDMDYGRDFEYLPAMEREALRLGSFNGDRLQMGHFSIELGDFYLVSYYSGDYDEYKSRVTIPVMTVRINRNGRDDGFGDYMPDFNLELLVTAVKDGEVLFDTAFRFISLKDGKTYESEYYKAGVRLSHEGKRIALTGDNPPWETSHAEMLLTTSNARLRYDAPSPQTIQNLFDQQQPDRVVISYAALRTQTATRVFTVYDKFSDSFSRNDYSIDDFIYGLAEEDDFGTRYIVAKNVDNVYCQLIAPAYFSEEEYKSIITPVEGENARNKFHRIFESMVPVTYG